MNDRDPQPIASADSQTPSRLKAEVYCLDWGFAFLTFSFGPSPCGTVSIPVQVLEAHLGRDVRVGDEIGLTPGHRPGEPSRISG